MRGAWCASGGRSSARTGPRHRCRDACVENATASVSGEIGQTVAVDVTEVLEAQCAPATLFAWIEDLSLYPRWLNIVPQAVPDPADPNAWVVDLRGRLGPLARSKRLRMVRTVHEPHERVVFERQERDGREHAPWVLRARVEGVGSASRLTMELHYGGSMWGPVLERVLGDEVARSRAGLARCVANGPPA